MVKDSVATDQRRWATPVNRHPIRDMHLKSGTERLQMLLSVFDLRSVSRTKVLESSVKRVAPQSPSSESKTFPLFQSEIYDYLESRNR